MIRILAFDLALLLAASPTLAETGGKVGGKAAKIDCANAMSQVEMTYCAEQDWNAADAELNTAYAATKDLMKQIDAALPADQQGAVTSLRDAQRAWIAFRDSACAAEGYTMRGGTGESMVIYSCRARLTQARTADLQALSAGN